MGGACGGPGASLLHHHVSRRGAAAGRGALAAAGRPLVLGIALIGALPAGLRARRAHAGEDGRQHSRLTGEQASWRAASERASKRAAKQGLRRQAARSGQTRRAAAASERA